MSKTDLAVAVFDSHEQAEDAVRELAKSGFDMKGISIGYDRRSPLVDGIFDGSISKT